MKLLEDKQNVKKKNFSEKYTKDLVATKKKLAEIEYRLQASDKLVRHTPSTRHIADMYMNTPPYV